MSENQALSGEEEISWFWEEVEGDVKATLSAAQRIAIEDAVRKSTSQSHPADLRLYLGKYFVRIIAGKERRNRSRLKKDLKRNPIFTGKNAPIIIVFWALLFCSTVYVLALVTNIFEGFLFN